MKLCWYNFFISVKKLKNNSSDEYFIKFDDKLFNKDKSIILFLRYEVIIVRVDFISSGNSYRCSGSELLKKLKIERFLLKQQKIIIKLSQSKCII